MKIDLHTHTVLSGHAYSTLKENIDEAARLGLEAIAVTDHGPAMPGATDFFQAVNLANAVPSHVNGVRVVYGIEANIIDYKGTIDLPKDFGARLEYILASLHGICLIPRGEKENTDTVLLAMEKELIDAVAHPDDPNFPIDYQRLCEGAKKYKVALEINNMSLKGIVRKKCREQTLKMLKCAKELGVYIVVGSDAHFYTGIGDLKLSEEILREVNYPEELIVNSSLERLESFLEMRQEERNG